MTVKELRNILNNIDSEYDESSVVIFEGKEKKYVDSICKISSPMGKPCCVELRLKE